MQYVTCSRVSTLLLSKQLLYCMLSIHFVLTQLQQEHLEAHTSQQVHIGVIGTMSL